MSRLSASRFCGRCRADRTSRRRIWWRSSGPTSVPSRAARCTTPSACLPTSACSVASSRQGHQHAYEDRVGDNHHHLICRACGQMVDVDCAVGATPCLTAADGAGYEIDEAEVIYWGRCPTCREAAEGA